MLDGVDQERCDGEDDDKGCHLLGVGGVVPTRRSVQVIGWPVEIDPTNKYLREFLHCVCCSPYVGWLLLLKKKIFVLL